VRSDSCRPLQIESGGRPLPELIRQLPARLGASSELRSAQESRSRPRRAARAGTGLVDSEAHGPHSKRSLIRRSGGPRRQSTGAFRSLEKTSPVSRPQRLVQPRRPVFPQRAAPGQWLEGTAGFSRSFAPRSPLFRGSLPAHVIGAHGTLACRCQKIARAAHGPGIHQARAPPCRIACRAVASLTEAARVGAAAKKSDCHPVCRGRGQRRVRSSR